MLRELSTSPGHQVAVGNRTLQYNNTNRLVKNPDWDIGLQKTGYISEAGQCLVMQAKVAGRKLIMVFLDSAGKLSRIGDAERVRRWVEANRRHVPRLPATRSSGRSAADAAAPRNDKRRLRAVCLALQAHALRGSAACSPAPTEISLAVACSLVSQPSSSRSAGAEIDRPATSLPWSS